ncbi:MAG: NAD(+) diphosphatase [Alphaproteobacteria bacterium]|nr:NAD(+) diphosphatase [Alphaproteobacteria bacterium]MDE2013289.1 NAD(+) diphosphatase [Alphaproteobacteria bacterium]MDE2075198.1 NAD(+) diphosphatase [Alphaproteobacteria bacterium]MDE2352898.1 NAD(+) diphosphatase [Alphaproteobacteria bacterium]
MIPFTGNPLDRAGERRGNAAWLAERRRDPSSLVLPLWRLQPFFIGPEKGPAEAGFLKPGLAEPLAAPDAPCVLLGLEKAKDGTERALFALDISAASNPANAGPLAGLGHFRELRAAAMGGGLPEGDIAILGQAKAMIDWHQRHGFCARCGAATVLADAGYRRHCASCGTDHFPRTDPVVIMLATLGDECLVGRGRQFPPGMMSALAGFIEPGETIEEAVRRELMEEAGVKVGAVRYHASQHWPFPSSLMIGCFAEAEGRDIHLRDNELAEARWLTRAQVRAFIVGGAIDGLFLPPPVAIAHHLMKAWVEE